MSTPSETPSSDTANLHGASLIDAAFAEAFAAPDTAAPVPPVAEPTASGASGAAPDDDAHEQPAREESAPPAAPDVLTLTPAELQAKIDEATKRAREDQSSAARARAALERDLREARAVAHARQEALNKLQEDAGQRYLSRPDVLEEQFRAQNYARQLIEHDEQSQQQAVDQEGQLTVAKEQAARTDYLDAVSNLMEEAGPLGMKREQVDAILEEIIRTDKLAAAYVADFDSATDMQQAKLASQRLYLVLDEKARVRLQAAKMAEIATTAPPKPRIDRPQVHGSGGNVGNDPYRGIKNWGERGARRLDDAFAAWAATQKE